LGVGLFEYGDGLEGYPASGLAGVPSGVGVGLEAGSPPSRGIAGSVLEEGPGRPPVATRPGTWWNCRWAMIRVAPVYGGTAETWWAPCWGMVRVAPWLSTWGDRPWEKVRVVPVWGLGGIQGGRGPGSPPPV